MEERRKEPRIRTRGLVRLVTSDATVSGHIFDWSNSGACVEADGPLPKGVPVLMEAEGFETSGTIRYCAPSNENNYLIGLALDEH